MSDSIEQNETRTIFSIPAENMPKFEQQIAKLSRKSVKLIGQPITPFVFGHEEQTLSDGHMHRVYTVMLTAEIPKLEGWTFIARLDHSNDTGTIVRKVPNLSVELPSVYREAKSTTCDHCGHKRYRRDTFVICEDATGEFKQVGSTCLHDFFGGKDPSKVAKMAELLGYAYECGTGAEQFVGGDRRWVAVEDYCAYSAMAIRMWGWTSGSVARLYGGISTREHAYELMTKETHGSYNEQDEALAQEALAWAQSLREKDNANDYEHNIMVIAEAVMIEYRSMGLAASIVGVFQKRKNEEAARALAAASAAMPRVADVGDFGDAMAFFKNSKLKFPKMRLALPDGRPVALSVAGPNSKYNGSIMITDGGPYGNNIWYGHVSPNGAWNRSNKVDATTMTSLTALLTALAVNPADTAAKYGHMTGNCCFCSLPLTDEKSTAVGYGKVCAKKWGLPYGAKVARAAVAARTAVAV